MRLGIFCKARELGKRSGSSAIIGAHSGQRTVPTPFLANDTLTATLSLDTHAISGRTQLSEASNQWHRNETIGTGERYGGIYADVRSITSSIFHRNPRSQAPSGYNAELLQDRKAVHQVPRLSNQAILVEPVKIPKTCLDFFAGRQHTHHSRTMSCGC